MAPHPRSNDGDLARDSNDGSPSALGLHQPHAHAFRLLKRSAHVGVAGMGDMTGIVLLAGLKAPGRKPEVGSDGARTLETGRIVDCGFEA